MALSTEEQFHSKTNKWLKNIIELIGSMPQTSKKISQVSLNPLATEIIVLAESAISNKETPHAKINKIKKIIDLLETIIENKETPEDPNDDTTKFIEEANRSHKEGIGILIHFKIHSSQDDISRTAEKRLKQLETEIATANSMLNEIKKATSESEGKLANINSRYADLRETATSMQEKFQLSIKESLDAAEEIISKLRKKEDEVNIISGIVSGASIGGKYEYSAQIERRAANWARLASLTLMGIIAIIIGNSLLKIGDANFKWESAILRLIFSAALSIPAAYLSRESTRHRNKQYEFQQMSLELQAITPYIASLPQEEQHKLKAEMANRFFGSKGQLNSSDSYPVNTQELIMKIIEKLPSKPNT